MIHNPAMARVSPKNTGQHPLNCFLLALLTLATLNFSQAASSDPPYYQKLATWQETMLASSQALVNTDLKNGFAAFESETMRGGQGAQAISLPLGNADEMYLFVTGSPDVKWGMADWAEARLIGRDGSTNSLRSLKTIKVLLGRHEWDLTLRSGLYQKMRMGGRQFEHGLHVQANSVVLVPLHGEYEKFEAQIGIDDWAGTNGHVRFGVVGARMAAHKRLWEWVARDFPEERPRQEMRWEQEDRVLDQEWSNWPSLAARYAKKTYRVPSLAAEAGRLASAARSQADLARVRSLYYHSRELDSALAAAREFNFRALRMALEDLSQSFPSRYSSNFAIRLPQLENSLRAAVSQLRSEHLEDFEAVARAYLELQNFQREALLANPLLDFDRLLLIKRKPSGEPRRSQWDDRGLGEYIGLPKQSSWGNGTMPNIDKWDNEIAVLSPVRPEGKLTTLFKTSERQLVCDLDLNFDGDKMLFSMPDQRKHWQVHEIRADGSDLRQLTPADQPDVHCYDPCYLPSGKIIFNSTAVMQGVPCNAGVIVGMLYRMDADGSHIQQLCFEQDHDYTPSVLNDGRVLYLRWDYTDTPHVWNRLLMSMNPDGTEQMEYYGDNSYWPNATFFSRAIPKHPTKIAGIVTGHHEGRIGELVIFDPVKGLRETDGVVQRIPGYGQKVEPVIEDKLTEHSWPKFLHPWPLSDKYFLAVCKPTPDSLWGIYLVDVFDNMVLVKEEENFVLVEPIPFRKRAAPPIIPDKVQPARKDALVYMEDVYKGPGLHGVPHGTVKSLRLFTYHFGYQTLAGIDHRVGADGPWEIKRVLGTVPVEADGSAWFRVPAKTPISLQPLDAEGKAVALMRSWMTAMPGENVSCVGCHERPSAAPLVKRRLALARSPSEIAPWHGPPRGFSFDREVQPVLDKHCVGCHNADSAGRAVASAPPDLRRDQGAYIVYEAGKLDGRAVRGVPKEELLGRYSGVFEPSYVALRQYVRVGGLESDVHILPAKEFHADTSELIQMLQKGHHGVRLDAESWDRLITWIDLNAPCHGSWREVTRLPGNQRERRLALRKLYGGLEEDGELIPEMTAVPIQPIIPPTLETKPEAPQLAGWPLTIEEAGKKQAQEESVTRTLEIGDGLKIEFVKIPAGSFVMGDTDGAPDERPAAVVQIQHAFWMSKFEVSNEQFARFNSAHDSRFEHRSSWIFSEEYLGWRLNHPRQPVVRVSWQEAVAFCRWLSEKSGQKVTLPTEAQWEYACRAGTATPLSYGDLDADFSRFANLGDVNLRKLADEGWRPKSPDLVPRENRFNDGALVTAEVGSYQPNAWGLYDMHGNAAEWTRSAYAPYPYQMGDGRDKVVDDGLKMVRGGSWRDRPKLARSASRWRYPAYQKVYNVGFRIIIETEDKVALR